MTLSQLHYPAPAAVPCPPWCAGGGHLLTAPDDVPAHLGPFCAVPPAPGGHVCAVEGGTLIIGTCDAPVEAQLVSFGGEPPQIELSHADNVLAGITLEAAAELARGILALVAAAGAL